MVTLVDNELFDYLTHLESEVSKRISASNERGLQHLMHFQMREIVIAERDVLKYINSNGTQPVLSISPNGLPSVASLNPDLEKMCELSEHETSFGDVAQRFKKGVNGKNKGEEGHLYVPVSEEEWGKELANRDKEKLQSQVGFAISETDDGKFELAIREDIHLQGYDQYSREFPVLIREGKMRYHVVWNRLVNDSEENFYVPNTALVLQGRPIKPPKKQFGDLTIFYAFSGSDFKGVRKSWFIRGRRDSIDYSSFLSAGTNARVRTTEKILEAIGRALEKQVILKGIGKNYLSQTLAFSAIPFENAPKTIPKEEDLYYEAYNNITYNRTEPKYQTKFDLIFTTGGGRMGQIEYVLPCNKRERESICYNAVYRFTKGGINLTVFGDSVWNEEQDYNLQNELRKVRKSKRVS